MKEIKVRLHSCFGTTYPLYFTIDGIFSFMGYFLSMNTKKSLVTTFSLLLLALLSACTRALESPQLFIPDIISLKEYLPQLEQTARKWRSDAVLTWVEIPIQYDNTSIITTGFDSPTVQESILLRVKPDGKIELEKVKHEIELEIFLLMIG